MSFKKVAIADAVEKSKLVALKFSDKGQRIRVSFIPDADGDLMLYAVEYFKYSKKYEFSCKVTGNPVIDKLLQAKLGAPEVKYFAPVIVYDTDSTGKPVNYNFKIAPLLISASRVGMFKNVDAEWGLGNIDLILTCKNLDFQDYEVTPTKVRVIDAGLSGGHISRSVYDTVVDSVDLNGMANLIAYDFDPDKASEKLGIPASVFTSSDSDELPTSTASNTTDELPVPTASEPIPSASGDSDELPNDLANKVAM